MKRLVASRRLQRTCNICDCSFSKGNVYYKKRNIITEDDGTLYTYENTLCPRCRYKREEREVRFNLFKEKCRHPKTETIWTYIPGEAVKEPAYDMCLYCRKKGG